MSEQESTRRQDTASRVISADPDRIWRAFTDPDALMAWLPPGRMTGRVLQYEFREGGRYRIELRYDESAGPGAGKTTASTDVTTGRFLEVKAGKRLVQSVEFESADASFGGEMLLSWSFERVPGGTRVTISADNVPPGISRADHGAGLRGSLENLSRYVG